MNPRYKIVTGEPCTCNRLQNGYQCKAYEHKCICRKGTPYAHKNCKSKAHVA